MKLGILIYSLSGGGAERVVSYLAAYCVENNIEIVLILMNDNIQYKIPSEVEIFYIEKSNSNESGYKKALKIPFLAYKYSKLVKNLKITHSLSFLTRPSFINILASKLTNYNFKVITNERAFPSLQYGYKGFQSTFNKKMIKLLYQKSDLVISNSHGSATDLMSNFNVPSEKLSVLHNPIDLNKIEIISPIESFFDKSKFNIITIGRLDQGKNHQMLIEAFHKLKNPKLKLYIFGYGELQNELELLISNLNLEEHVILMGFNPNPYQYLKAANLFIFGSNHEGFPNVILEAMACGLPILSTNCQSGPSEIMKLQTVINDLMITDYGILVPIKNVDLIAKGINYFLNDKNYIETCRKNGQIRIKDFEKNHILKEYIDLINTTSKVNS